MALKNNYFLLLIILPLTLFGELQELVTKQDLINIRYTSSDGKITYYQNSSGSLILSRFYSAFEVYKRTPNTQYFLEVGKFNKKILIMIQENFFTTGAINAPHELALIDYGGKNPILLGEGISPKLHLKDTWVSYFHPQTKILRAFSVENKSIDFDLRIKATTNPYFIPDLVMIDSQNILYTDINSEGKMGILKLDRANKSTLAILKARRPGVKIELCLNESIEKLFVGYFGQSNVRYGTKIVAYDLKNGFDLKKGDNLYSSTKNDPGHLLCDDKDWIYFIKNYSPSNSEVLVNSDVAKIELKTKKVLKVSELNQVTHLIKMDDRILIPFQGKVYVAKGKSDAKTDVLKGKKR